jgi:hypothetical protein
MKGIDYTAPAIYRETNPLPPGWRVVFERAIVAETVAQCSLERCISKLFDNVPSGMEDTVTYANENYSKRWTQGEPMPLCERCAGLAMST